MKLALVLDRFEPDHGGLEHWAWQWTTWLLDHGHEVEVVAAEAMSGPPRAGLTLHRLGGPTGGDGTRTMFAERVAAVLPRLDADVIHDLGVGWYCDILQPQFGTRLADDRRNLASMPPGRRLGTRLSWRRRRRLADIRRLERRQYVSNGPLVVAVSRMTQADLSATHGIPPDRIEVIHNGVDAGRFTPPPAEVRAAARRLFAMEAAVTLVFVGHNFRLKGLGTVLRAMARLRSRDLGLLVVGRGPIKAATRLAASLGIAERVRFAGWVGDVRAAYAAADAFVQPTFYDPCSLTVLEAAASGLPVLTSRFNGAAELFRHGESAWVLADSADDRAAATAIDTWIDRTVRLRMGAAARTVAEAATHDRCFSQLFAVCDRVARTRQAA